MMRSSQRLLLLAAAVVVAAPLHADWIVTVDGAEIETEGAWKVQGSQVVFTLPGGSLAALPAAEVDLEASEARTNPPPAAPAAQPAATPARPRAEGRWVLTDADVARAWLPAAPAADGEAGEAEETAPAAAPSSVEGLSVSSWEEVDAEEVDSGIALRGTVRNGGRDVAANISIKVVLYDADGQLLELRTATPGRANLEPGQSSEFRIDFPDVTDFSGVQFTVEAQGLASSGAAAGSGEEDGEEGG